MDVWREYMANNSQYISGNTAHAYGGSYAKASFGELMHPQIETQTAQEIVNDIAERAGLTII